jgi:CBS-domain-containing membrane protein
MFWSVLGSFIGILCVSAMNNFWSPDIKIQFLVASFGASSVLIYGLPESKLSQPRNFIGGQVLSSIVGVVVRLIIHVPWVASPVAMSTALLVMQVTATVHPPGGATALIVAMMDELPKWNGFSYVVGVAFGSIVMLGVALVVNNMAPNRQYPTFWY